MMNMNETSTPAYVAKLSNKGLITLPQPIRKHLGAEIGNHLIFRVDSDGRVFIDKAIFISATDKKE